jgi:uncharacterized protein YggE
MGILNSKISACSGKKDCCGGQCECKCSWFGKRLLLVILGLLLVYLVVFVGTLIRNNMKKYEYIGKADRMERTIVINGFGKVSGNNDIAVTTIGYSNVDKDVAKAQANNKKVMDQVMAELKKLGVEDKDMQSNYTIFPEYNWTQQKGQELIGYKVSNHLTVKIRDLGKIPAILGLAGKYGATEVSGLSFTIDDSENLKADARDAALADARNKAKYLADRLGVKLGSVIAYNEYESGGSDYLMKSYGMLGAEGGGAPESVASGSRDVSMYVNITYEIFPR